MSITHLTSGKAIKRLQEENAKLKERNQYLENELKQAKQLFQDIINDWEVHQEEEVKSNLLDEMFDNPLQQLNKLF